MAMIKCPECGRDVSDKAEKCIHCGYPLGGAAGAPQTAGGTLVVYGYTGFFLVKPKLKLYLNGAYIGEVSHQAKTKEIPLTGPSAVEIKCGIRSTSVRLFPDKHNEVYTQFDRTTGSIIAELRTH